MKKIALSASLACITQLVAGTFFVQPNMVLAPAYAKSSHSNSHSLDAGMSEENIGGKPYSIAKVVVHAHPEQVWQVLSDYGNAARVFPMLKKCQVIEDHGTTKIVKHVVSPSGPAGTYQYTLELKEQAPHVMEWHRIAGDFKEVDGCWRLEPLDGGHSTLVTYASHVNGGLFIPQMLIKRQNRADMPQVMAALKKQAEGNSIQIAGRPGSPSHTE
ncbi:MAG: SRPBCC family protein [Terriglobales bacterium]